jgi:hypothetical protein
MRLPARPVFHQQNGCRVEPRGHQHARLDLDRLVDHPLLVFIVAHGDIADQREILAERMADETVIGHDPAQVRMTLEDNTVQVERLALIPVDRIPDLDQRRQHRQFVIR